jgi:hypothetical protein
MHKHPVGGTVNAVTRSPRRIMLPGKPLYAFVVRNRCQVTSSKPVEFSATPADVPSC